MLITDNMGRVHALIIWNRQDLGAWPVSPPVDDFGTVKPALCCSLWHFFGAYAAYCHPSFIHALDAAQCEV